MIESLFNYYIISYVVVLTVFNKNLYNSLHILNNMSTHSPLSVCGTDRQSDIVTII